MLPEKETPRVVVESVMAQAPVIGIPPRGLRHIAGMDRYAQAAEAIQVAVYQPITPFVLRKWSCVRFPKAKSDGPHLVFINAAKRMSSMHGNVP